MKKMFFFWTDKWCNEAFLATWCPDNLNIEWNQKVADLLKDRV